MSTATATRPSRRTLERRGMTPDEELELLIAEQQADDVYFVRKPLGEISLEAPAPGGFEGSVSDYIGLEFDFDAFDPDASGEVVSYLPRSEESLFAVGFPHGTFNAYNNHKCRCTKCKSFFADYRRRKRAES
jgi:hypothetical protein